MACLFPIHFCELHCTPSNQTTADNFPLCSEIRTGILLIALYLRYPDIHTLFFTKILNSFLEHLKFNICRV